MSRSARGPRPRSEAIRVEPIDEQNLTLLRTTPEKSAGQAEAAGERFGGIVERFGELIEQGSVVVEHIGDRGLEQLFLAVEVVVERPHPNVCGLRYLQHGHVGLARRKEHPCGLNQRRARPLFAPLQPVDRVVLPLTHPPTIAGKLSFDDFVRIS